MIRFIDLGLQYWLEMEPDLQDDPEPQHFAFIDTVIDRFVDVSGSQFWDNWDDFQEDYSASEGWDDRVSGGKMPLERFRGLMEGKYGSGKTTISQQSS